MRRSKVKEFYLKQKYLFCAKACKPVDPRHPDTWDTVVQLERKGVINAPPFEGVVLACCDDRNAVWSREDAMHCNGVHDLVSVEAQYHL